MDPLSSKEYSNTNQSSTSSSASGDGFIKPTPAVQKSVTKREGNCDLDVDEESEALEGSSTGRKRRRLTDDERKAKKRDTSAKWRENDKRKKEDMKNEIDKLRADRDYTNSLIRDLMNKKISPNECVKLYLSRFSINDCNKMQNESANRDVVQEPESNSTNLNNSTFQLQDVATDEIDNFLHMDDGDFDQYFMRASDINKKFDEHDKNTQESLNQLNHKMDLIIEKFCKNK